MAEAALACRRRNGEVFDDGYYYAATELMFGDSGPPPRYRSGGENIRPPLSHSSFRPRLIPIGLTLRCHISP